MLDYFALNDDFPYKEKDPLVPYIDPDSYMYGGGGKNINDLKKKEYNPNKQTPMFRLLYSTKALAFTNPQNSKGQFAARFFIPDALLTSVQNVYAQVTNDNPLDFQINSAFASMYMGTYFGLGLADNGSSLVPSWSGSATRTPFLNNTDVDVKKVSYDGAFNYNNSKEKTSLATLVGVTSSTLLATWAVFSWAPQLGVVARTGIVMAAAIVALPFAYPAIAPFIADFEPSHKAPVTSTQQSQWKSSPNAYSKILDGTESYTPYQMEEFLYEKPFVNIRVGSSYSNDWNDMKEDTLGLYVGDSLKPVYIADKLSNPLSFKSGSDWEIMGAKKERWELATGVGNSKIPIRHADRYPMPGFMVKDYIEQYKFEVDDLMPHRLRQIRINFNEDIGWECDVDKAETDPAACKVYKRTPDGKGWQYVKDAKHPVNRNGLFVFKPRDFYDGLSAIQKDNQNTVTISI